MNKSLQNDELLNKIDFLFNYGGSIIKVTQATTNRLIYPSTSVIKATTHILFYPSTSVIKTTTHILFYPGRNVWIIDIPVRVLTVCLASLSVQQTLTH